MTNLENVVFAARNQVISHVIFWICFICIPYMNFVSWSIKLYPTDLSLGRNNYDFFSW